MKTYWERDCDTCKHEEVDWKAHEEPCNLCLNGKDGWEQQESEDSNE